MPVPKKHKTHQTTRQRRSHMALAKTQFGKCAHCGSPVAPHHVCSHCGYYKGKEVVNTLAKTTKKQKKVQVKREMEAQAQKAAESGSLESLSRKKK